MCPLMEVTCATDVGMNDRRPVRGRVGPFAINIVLEDRVDRRVGPRADIEGTSAGRFQPVRAMRLGQPDNADAGSKALFGMRALAQDDLDERRRAGAEQPGPALLKLCFHQDLP